MRQKKPFNTRTAPMFNSNDQRNENLKVLVKQFGTQTALANWLRRFTGRPVFTQQKISLALSTGTFSYVTARQIERAFYLPPLTLERVCLKVLEAKGFNVRSWITMEDSQKSVPRGLLEILVDQTTARQQP